MNEIDDYLNNETILPKVPSYEEAVKAQRNVIDQSIMLEDEEIIPIKKTYQEYSQPFSSSQLQSNLQSDLQPNLQPNLQANLQADLQGASRHGNVTPEATETKSAVSGLGS